MVNSLSRPLVAPTVRRCRVLPKVLSEVEQKQQEESNGTHETGVKADDLDYEIRVEAYDPVVLRHHVLHLLDENIKQCLSDHPHLYTLGCVAKHCSYCDFGPPHPIAVDNKF